MATDVELRVAGWVTLTSRTGEVFVKPRYVTSIGPPQSHPDDPRILCRWIGLLGGSAHLVFDIQENLDKLLIPQAGVTYAEWEASHG